MVGFTDSLELFRSIGVVRVLVCRAALETDIVEEMLVMCACCTWVQLDSLLPVRFLDLYLGCGRRHAQGVIVRRLLHHVEGGQARWSRKERPRIHQSLSGSRRTIFQKASLRKRGEVCHLGLMVYASTTVLRARLRWQNSRRCIGGDAQG